jgi:Glyoxalase-like domain
VQITFDCADPDRVARFWASALGYRLQDPPAGFASWPDFLAAQCVPEEHLAAPGWLVAVLPRMAGAGRTAGGSATARADAARAEAARRPSRRSENR